MGSYLCKALLEHGEEVVVFDRPEARYLDLVRKQGAGLFVGDFLNRDDLRRALSGCDLVYHLASTTVPQTSNDDPVYDVDTNILGTLHLLDEAKKAKVKKIVFVSSGGTVYGIPQEIPIKENHPTEPTSSYGICKLAIEKYLHLYWILYGLDYYILRIANAYGERQPITDTQGVISSFLDKAIRGDELVIWGDGAVVRDYVYIEDIANALARAASYEGELKVFNVGAGKGHSINDIINIIERITNQSLKLKYIPGRTFDVPTNVLDITRAKTHLKWEPVTDLFEGIARTYDRMLEKYQK